MYQSGACQPGDQFWVAILDGLVDRSLHDPVRSRRGQRGSRLLQAVEQDSLSVDERKRWLLRAVHLFNAFAPGSPKDVRSWGTWLLLSRHAETLIDHAEHNGLDELPIAVVASKLGLFLKARAMPGGSPVGHYIPLRNKLMSRRKQVL